MNKTQNKTVWIAVVATKYEAWAVADTEEKARTAAIKKAVEFLKEVDALYGRTHQEVADEVGVNSYELVLNGEGELF